MSAWTLDETPSTVEPFDVLTGPSAEADYPTHLMLCVESHTRSDVTPRTSLAVGHMMPPLRTPWQSKCRHVGHVDLSGEQKEKIATFVGERVNETRKLERRRREHGARPNRPHQYRIHPAFSQPNLETRYWRFSCVGFVLAAYQKAAIYLVGTPKSVKTAAELKILFSQPKLDDSNWRQRMGLEPDRDAWPVIFPAHVLHSMNRDPADVQGNTLSVFIPEDGDEYFPRRETAEPNN